MNTEGRKKEGRGLLQRPLRHDESNASSSVVTDTYLCRYRQTDRQTDVARREITASSVIDLSVPLHYINMSAASIKIRLQNVNPDLFR